MKYHPDELITQKQAAEIRGVSPQAINFLVKQGRFQLITIGGRNFLLRAEVESYEPGKPGPKPQKSLKRVNRTSRR